MRVRIHITRRTPHRVRLLLHGLLLLLLHSLLLLLLLHLLRISVLVVDISVVSLHRLLLNLLR